MKVFIFSTCIFLLILTSCNILPSQSNYSIEEHSFESIPIGQDVSVIPTLGCSGNCPVISNDFSRSGNNSLRTFVDRKNSPNMYRTEVTHKTKMEVNNGDNTQDYWMGFSIFIPGPYPKLLNPTYEIVFQFHSSPIDDDWSTYAGYNPNLAIRLEPTSDHSGKFIFNIKGSDDPYPQFPDNKPPNTLNITAGNYQTNVWYDFVIHTKQDSYNGFTKLWFNGEQVVDFTGSNYYRGHGKSYAKFGLYNGWRDRDISEPVETRLLYHDEFRFAWGEGANYDLVAPGP